MTKTRKPCGPRPCNDCPWRRNAAPGWLGGASPERFMLSIYAESPLPCHQTVNYEDPRWLSKWVADKGSGRLCAGALAYYANTCKRPRNPELLHVVDTDPNVFRSPTEFITFHRPPPPPKRARRRLPHHATPARSWSDEEDAWGLRAWKAYLALPLAGYAAELLGLRLEELP